MAHQITMKAGPHDYSSVYYYNYWGGSFEKTHFIQFGNFIGVEKTFYLKPISIVFMGFVLKRDVGVFVVNQCSFSFLLYTVSLSSQ